MPTQTPDETWQAILATHAIISFWRAGWRRASHVKRPPFLQTTAEYIERRWDRANQRMATVMQRADEFRAKHPDLTQPLPEPTRRRRGPINPNKSKTPRTDKLDKELQQQEDILAYQKMRKHAQTLEKELDAEMDLRHSARYILEDANPEKLADACGLPLGVITAALKNILPVPEDFQHAPYEQLCGCVSAPIPTGWRHHWQAGSNPDATRHLIEASEGNRTVKANCETCGGSGLLPKKNPNDPHHV